MRRYTSPTIAEFPFDIVRLACTRCDRKGHYRKSTLIKRYGPDITGPDLLTEVADCPNRRSLGGACGVMYPDLLNRVKDTPPTEATAYGPGLPLPPRPLGGNRSPS